MPSNARLYKTEAIILRQRRFGDADRILTLYTPTRGKIDLKARGVRKTSSRTSGHLQPLSHCMVQIAQGHSIDVITGVETIESFRPIREDLDRLGYALYIAELTDRMTPEHAPAYPIYKDLLDVLTRLSTELEVWSATRFFEMRLLNHAGFRPELAVCVACGAALPAIQNYFAPVTGGAVCAACAGSQHAPQTLSLNALKLMRLLLRGPFTEAARVRIPDDLAREVERHLRAYIITVLERDVSAAAFIERLRKDRLASARPVPTLNEV
jgi:DNA repair protein RecO (recombination protein O)